MGPSPRSLPKNGCPTAWATSLERDGRCPLQPEESGLRASGAKQGGTAGLDLVPAPDRQAYGARRASGRASTPEAVPDGAARARFPGPRGAGVAALGGARRFCALGQRSPGRPGVRVLRGPPTANGRPGLHHVWARAYKDLICRYRTMTGRRVARRAGWDTHGLAVEVEVEKALGLSGKDQIEDYGVDRFVERCRRSVYEYVDDWKALTRRIGYWVDLDHAYWTLDPAYIDSVWWHLSRLWEAGDLFEDVKVVPYCPRCGTSLSSHELGQPDVYQDVEDLSAYVRLPIVGEGPAGAEALVVWTTTPWTLVANTAVAVRPDLTYVVVDGLVMAEKRVEAVLGPGAPERVTARVPGRPPGRRPLPTPHRRAGRARGRGRLAGGAGGFRKRRRGQRPGPYRSGLRRGRLAAGPARRTADSEPGRARWPVRGRRLAERPSRAGSQPGHSGPTCAGRAGGEGRGSPPLVPALLAVRDSAHLLGQAVVVRGYLEA